MTPTRCNHARVSRGRNEATRWHLISPFQLHIVCGSGSSGAARARWWPAVRRIGQEMKEGTGPGLAAALRTIDGLPAGDSQ